MWSENGVPAQIFERESVYFSFSTFISVQPTSWTTFFVSCQTHKERNKQFYTSFCPTMTFFPETPEKHMEYRLNHEYYWFILRNGIYIGGYKSIGGVGEAVPNPPNLWGFGRPSHTFLQISRHYLLQVNIIYKKHRLQTTMSRRSEST